MSSQALGIQRAIVEALEADTGIGALIDDRIFDAVPTSPAFPYVTIGSAQTIEDGADCNDGEEIVIEIHIWSRAVGSAEAKQIGGALKAALHEQDLATETGLRLIDLSFRDALYRLDPDGITTHGIAQFVALSESA